MKPKMIQLLLMFLMISLFSSSKENSDILNGTCSKLKCLQKIEPVLQQGEKKAAAEEEVAEYPFALAPGSYMFRY